MNAASRGKIANGYKFTAFLLHQFLKGHGLGRQIGVQLVDAVRFLTLAKVGIYLQGHFQTGMAQEPLGVLWVYSGII